MIPYRQLSFGRHFSAHYFGRYYFLRLLPFPGLRSLITWLIARWVALRNGTGPRTHPTAEVTATVNRVRDQGWSALPPLFTNAQIDDIHRYLATQPALDRQRELIVTPETNDAQRAQYRAVTILKCPHVLSALNNPTVLSVAEKFLGCKPTISALGLQWSFPTARKPADVQTFHRDTEAWRLLNLFVYLTDVGEGHGPHRYVLTSHRTRGRLRIKPYSDAAVAERFGAERIHTIVGPRGTTFMENGWGIHEGHPPRDGRRLMLAVMYSTGPIPIYDYDAIRIPAAHGHDKYVNRLLVSEPA